MKKIMVFMGLIMIATILSFGGCSEKGSIGDAGMGKDAAETMEIRFLEGILGRKIMKVRDQTAC